MLTAFRQKITAPFWASLLATLLIASLCLGALVVINQGKTVKGLTLSGLKIGGLTDKELGQLLRERAAQFSDQKISFVHGEKTWLLSPEEMGLAIKIEEAIADALNFGHDSLLAAAAQQTQSLLKSQDLTLDYSLDSAKLNQALQLFSDAEIPTKNASLRYEPETADFKIIPASAGAVVDRGQLVADVLTTFKSPQPKSSDQPPTVYLSLAEEPPQVTEEEIAQVAEEAKQLVESAPYFLQTADATWRVDKTELAGWISALPTDSEPQKTRLALDEKTIEEFLTPLAVSINREPIDAKLSSIDGKLKFAVLAQNGVKLSVAASAQKISNDILANKKNIYLVTESIEPKISNQNTQELGLLTLIGQGESNFSGSPQNRRVNIKVGATKLNGFLIKPGEEFSFSQNIGDIDAANGWLPELVIKNRQTILEYGGGLCQVSTTLFRAVVNSGLKVTERHPHAYPVHYYDPPGFDATVYPPSPDLKFLNDTPGHLLLQTKIEGNKLSFEIYGTADGREVKIIGPATIQKYPSGALKATLTQEIWRNGQLARKQVFNSSYNSPALYPNPNAKPAPTPSPASSGPSAPQPSATPTPSN